MAETKSVVVGEKLHAPSEPKTTETSTTYDRQAKFKALQARAVSTALEGTDRHILTPHRSNLPTAT